MTSIVVRVLTIIMLRAKTDLTETIMTATVSLTFLASDDDKVWTRT